MSGPLAFETMHDALRAVAEGTRLRILALLAEAELTVSDLTEILRQSQPRISRHLKLLSEANLIERHREGAWAFFRLAETGDAAQVVRMLVAQLDPSDPIVARDVPGFASSRLGVALGLEAIRMVEQGVASPATSTRP